jgi:hypothetical protein
MDYGTYKKTRFLIGSIPDKTRVNRANADFDRNEQFLKLSRLISIF